MAGNNVDCASVAANYEDFSIIEIRPSGLQTLVEMMENTMMLYDFDNL